MFEPLSHLPAGQLVYLSAVVAAFATFAAGLFVTHLRCNLPDRRS